MRWDTDPGDTILVWLPYGLHGPTGATGPTGAARATRSDWTIRAHGSDGSDGSRRDWSYWGDRAAGRFWRRLDGVHLRRHELVAGDPGSGKFRFDNFSVSLATNIYISEIAYTR